MKTNRAVDTKLEALREFQLQYPLSHVGGSIGLLLHGIDLQRDLTGSDLDITTPEFDTSKLAGFDERSDANDFDVNIKKTHGEAYTKIDIRITPEPPFTVISFDGHLYNVSLLSNIIWWKKKYAEKGVIKHKNDLITIETGVRPIEIKEPENDLLPF